MDDVARMPASLDHEARVVGVAVGGHDACTGPTLSMAATMAGASVAGMMPAPPGTTVLNGADISPYAPSASRQTAENE